MMKKRTWVNGREEVRARAGTVAGNGMGAPRKKACALKTQMPRMRPGHAAIQRAGSEPVQRSHRGG